LLKKTLKSGRNVLIKEISIDDIDHIKDTLHIAFNEGKPSGVTGLNKQKTLWIRKGLGGGDFRDWKANGSDVPDDVIRQLSDVEKEELSGMIQECQSMGEEIPSSSK